jgi:hypothetical protein
MQGRPSGRPIVMFVVSRVKVLQPFENDSAQVAAWFD